MIMTYMYAHKAYKSYFFGVEAPLRELLTVLTRLIQQVCLVKLEIVSTWLAWLHYLMIQL